MANQFARKSKSSQNIPLVQSYWFIAKKPKLLLIIQFVDSRIILVSIESDSDLTKGLELALVGNVTNRVTLPSLLEAFIERE